MPRIVFTSRKPAPRRRAIQRSAIVMRSTTWRQPTCATVRAIRAPTVSTRTSARLAERLGTRDWCSSSRMAQATLIARARRPALRGVRLRPRTKARSQSAARIAYSERWASRRVSQCRASTWPDAAHGARVLRNGTSQLEVCSELPASVENPTITTNQRTGGSQYFGRTPLWYKYDRDTSRLALSPEGLNVLRQSAGVPCEKEDRGRRDGRHPQVAYRRRRRPGGRP